LSVTVENDASKCVETFCYTISNIIGFHFFAKIVPRPNLQHSFPFCLDGRIFFQLTGIDYLRSHLQHRVHLFLSWASLMYKPSPHPMIFRPFSLHMS